MKALQDRQRETNKWKNVNENALKALTIEERVEHNRRLQYEEHQMLFGVMYSTIHKAALDGDVCGLKYFLSSKGKGVRGQKVNVDDFDVNGYCPIHYAAQRGKNDAIQMLVDAGCDVNVKSIDGSTALMMATKDNHLSTMRLLLCLGILFCLNIFV